MTRRITIATLLGTLIAFGQAAHVHAHAKGIKYQLTAKDKQYLQKKKESFDGAIRRKAIPSFELYLLGNHKYKTVRRGTTIHVTNLGKTGELEVFGTFGVSGHLMQTRYGGMSEKQLEELGTTDRIMLKLKPAGTPTWEKPLRVLSVKSAGLVTQAAATLPLTPGMNTVFYSRVAKTGGGIVHGSTPGLREIVIHWDGK